MGDAFFAGLVESCDGEFDGGRGQVGERAECIGAESASGGERVSDFCGR